MIFSKLIHSWFRCVLILMINFFISIDAFSTDTLTYSKDSTDLIVHSIIIAGNKITKEKIILRELTFSKGDTLSSQNIKEEIARSKQNLLNLSIFNFVTIEIQSKNNFSDIYILVEERWYIWPSVIFDNADRNVSNLIHEKNWSRVDYGFSIKKENFRGRNEVLKIYATFGYNEKYSISYDNIFLDRARRNSINYSLTYLENDAVDYMVLNNKLLGYKTSNGNIIKYHKASMAYSYRKKLYERHNVYLDYKNCFINDTIVSINPNFLGNGNKNMAYFYLTYNFNYDKRDSKTYPLKGKLFSIEFRKYGLGIINENDLSIFYIKSIFNNHFQLNKRFFYGNAVNGMYSFTRNYPFYIQKGLGWGKDYIRGYEYYVMDGKDYVLVKNSLKYELLPMQITTLHFVPLSKFNKVHYALYLNLSVDFGYVHDNTSNYKVYQNNMVNSPQYGYGLGIDLVTYYDNVLSLAYTINRYWGKGIFLHFHAPL